MLWLNRACAEAGDIQLDRDTERQLLALYKEVGCRFFSTAGGKRRFTCRGRFPEIEPRKQVRRRRIGFNGESRVLERLGPD
jgi:hypothetical protein